ncbi:hypothetical protein HB773_04630 [Sinorhizobium meliloti]|nr:hypothetical protein HB773_04630 [Sinorhizobium meliloti]
MSIESYRHYKESGVAWLGQVPEEWRIVPLKLVAQVVNGYPFNSKDFNGERGYPLIRIRDLGANEAETYYDGEFVEEAAITSNDVLIGMDGDFNVGRWHGKDRALLNQRVCCVRSASDLVTRWLEYALPFPLKAINDVTYATTVKHLSSYQVEKIRFALPPSKNEQAAIIAFLDRETAQIDALVEEQKRLIELLQEQRQAVISHAVTKGLNPGAPMKDTVIEWLGEVPEHWEVRPLKYLVKLESGGTPSKNNASYWGGEIPWASAKDLKTDRLSTTVQGITQLAIEDGAASTVAAGSVLVLVRGMMLARTFPVVVSSRPMAINQDLKALNGTGIRNEYLAWALRGTEAETLSRVDEAGHGTKALRMEAWTSMEIPVPPEEEQLRIAKALEEDIAAIDQLIVEVEAAISLLQERRAALISAAVTGKIDMRGRSTSPVITPDFRQSRKLVAAKIVEDLAAQKTFGRVKLQKLLYLAEAHSGVHELSGHYVREAAGPLDRDMVREVETALQLSGHVVIEQPEGRGTAVNYQLRGTMGAFETELQTLLGDRISALSELIETVGALDTRGAEAVATLYAVWNDALASGTVPSDDEIIREVLNEWHPKKAETFTVADLKHWLAWMHRNGLKPKGNAPVTSTERLFV